MKFSKIKSNNFGFTLIETLIVLFISVIMCGLLSYLIIMISSSSTKVVTKVNITTEKLIKDSYIRNWAKEINIPYWSNGNTIIDNAVEDLKLHPYYSDKIYSIEKIKDKREFVRGISVSYELSDGSIQKTDVLFPSYSVLK